MSSVDSKEQNRHVYKGVWLPKEVLEHSDLSFFHKILWSHISSLGSKSSPCYASNEWLSARMESTPGYVSQAIAFLVKKKLLKVSGFNGRTRWMHTIVEEEKKVEENQPPEESERQAACRKNDRQHIAATTCRVSQERQAEPGTIIGERTEDGEQKRSTNPVPPKGGLSDAEEIYAFYPLKVGKKKALKAIEKALKNHGKEILISKTKRYSEVRPPGTDFTPHPSTWFNDERFLDDESTWMPRGGPARMGHPNDPLPGVRRAFAREGLFPNENLSIPMAVFPKPL